MSRRPLYPVGPCLALGLLVSPAQGEARSATPQARPVETRACRPGAWAGALWPPPGEVTFRPTTLEERAAFTRLIPALLEAAPGRREPPAALRAAAETVGFQLDVVPQGDETFWVLREQPGRRRGAGAYVFRTGPATDDVIQAPHAYYDLGTGELGAALFACAPPGRRPRAFATNTAHRFSGRPGERRTDEGEHRADVAHNPDHLFQVVTDMLARSLPRLRVVQLHGFGESRRRGGSAMAAVVSAGSRQPSPWTRQVSRQLGTVLGQGVRLYPEQTEQLGGTRNAQARLLQAYPGARFLHLELSPRARRALTSRELLLRLADALLAPCEED